MRTSTICFTGHRRLSSQDLATLSDSLEALVKSYAANGFDTFCTGGALGFDTLAAQTVLKLKAAGAPIKLILILPCPQQTRGWKSDHIAVYEQIKSASDEIVYTSDRYTRGCMFKRNRALVDRSALCVAFLRKKTGGTAYTVRYAEAQGVPVVHI